MVNIKIIKIISSKLYRTSYLPIFIEQFKDLVYLDFWEFLWENTIHTWVLLAGRILVDTILKKELDAIYQLVLVQGKNILFVILLFDSSSSNKNINIRDNSYTIASSPYRCKTTKSYTWRSVLVFDDRTTTTVLKVMIYSKRSINFCIISEREIYK